MTGSLWKKILKWVRRYTPLHSSAGFPISALLSSYSTAEYGYLGYLVLLIQKQGMHSLRTSVIYANVQRGSQALLRFFLVHAAAPRMGLVRMNLYSSAIFIAGSQLLWLSPCRGTGPYFFWAVLLMTVGYAGGEESTSYILGAQVMKAQIKKLPKKTKPPEPEGPKGPKPLKGPKGRKGPKGPKAPKPPKEGSSGGSGVTEVSVQPGPGAGERCPCHFWREPPPARESGVSPFFWEGEQYNWRPHVCPIRDIEEANEGGRSCCYHPENTGSSGSDSPVPPPGSHFRGPPPGSHSRVTSPGPHDQRQSPVLPLQQIRNRIGIQSFTGKLPGAVAGTAVAAIYSLKLENLFKISTAMMVGSYNLFFWMGAHFYELDEMENYDIMDENGKDVGGAQFYEPDEMGNCDIMDKNGEDENEEDTEDESEDDREDAKKILKNLGKARKALLKLLPLWPAFVSTCYLVDATARSFFMKQVDYLENNTESSKIPTSVFYLIPHIVSFLTARVCYYLIRPHNDEDKEARWARLIRISIGMLFSSLCCLVASLVGNRLDCNYNSASMFWLLPQFLLWGMMKGIMEEGLEEYLHGHLDNVEAKKKNNVEARKEEKKKRDIERQVKAVCKIAESLGNYLSAILTAASPSSWLVSGNDISKSHLDNYYRMLAIITLSSTVVFTIFAIAYELREEEKREQSGKKG